jgi:hypothetical protein
MTPRERTGLFIEQHCSDLNYERREKIYYAVWNLLDETSKAAIEEEREACATIANREAEKVGAGNYGYLMGKTIENRIRARSSASSMEKKPESDKQ